MFLMTKHGASVVIFAPDNVLRRYKTVDHVMVTAGDHLGGTGTMSSVMSQRHCHTRVSTHGQCGQPGHLADLELELRFSILHILKISSVLWTFEMLNC